MVDDKKIEEAKDNIFNKHFLKNNEGMICIDHISEPVYLDYQIRQAIELGAKWAINEFLKDLWHPTGEAPKRGRLTIVENDGQIGRHYTIQINDYYSWENFAKGANITRWLYISDLLPKEGGENEKE